MERYIRVISGHSHLFRGQRLTPDTSPTKNLEASKRGTSHVYVEFSDGICVLAELKPINGSMATLKMPAYRTARGTVVSRRDWPVKISADTKGEYWKLGHSKKKI